MYDPTEEAHEFFGATRKEAVAKACSFYGREEGELDLHEFDQSEVSGLGARALVVAIPKGISPPGRGEARSPRIVVLLERCLDRPCSAACTHAWICTHENCTLEMPPC